MILKEQKFNNLETQAIANYKDLLLPRFPNGGIAFFALSLEDKNLFPFLLKFNQNESEISDKIFKNEYFAKYFRSYSVELLPSEYKRSQVKYFIDGFQLIADLAKLLFNGGCYFSTLKRLSIYKGQELSPKECLNEAQALIDTLFSENYSDFSFLKLEGIKWNTWFLEEYLSDSFFIFEKSKGIITVLIVKDTD